MGLHRDIDLMRADAAAKVKEAVAVMTSAGIPHYISETYRDQGVQDAYWAQGREPLDVVNQKRFAVSLGLIGPKENINVITKVKVSKHTSRLAIDICPATKKGTPWWSAPEAEYAKIAKVMKLYGFEWGGDWEDWKDLPHYEYKG